MEMTGEARIEAPRELVWEALNDPAVLQQSIPGCEELARTADNEFTAKVVSKVGPIKARFAGKVTLSNIMAPRSYTLTGEGQGGAAGFVKSDIQVSLDSPEPSVTLLRYGVKANVGGKLAQLGSRMVDAAARKAADEFFAQFGSVVARKADAAPRRDAAPAGAPAWIDAMAAAAIADVPMAPPRAARPEIQPAREAGDAAAGHPANQTAAQAMQPGTHSRTSDDEGQQALLDVWSSEKIKVWIADQVAVVTLNRPANRNAMTYAMWRAFPGLMAALDRNPEVRTIVLTGAGDDFCSGADIPEFELVRGDVAQATAYEEAVDACCDAIANVSKPAIAVVKGYCLGGGAHLAMSCDFRFASASAVFGIPAGRLSIVYGVRGTQKLRTLVGTARAKHILYSAERFDAASALAWGFVDRVAGATAAAPTGWWSRVFGTGAGAGVNDPMSDARAYARKLADNAPLSVAGAKFILNGLAAGPGALDWRAAELRIAQAAGSEDYREGRKAFAEKRAPRFQGR